MFCFSVSGYLFFFVSDGCNLVGFVLFVSGDFVFSVPCDLVVSVSCELFIFVSGDCVCSAFCNLVFSVSCDLVNRVSHDLFYLLLVYSPFLVIRWTLVLLICLFSLVLFLVI